MAISPQKDPETILREALVHARDELKRANDAHACIRPDVMHTVLDALQKVPAIPAIPHANINEKRIVGRLVTDLLAAGYSISVHDGEEETIVDSTDPAVIFPALCSACTDTLNLKHHVNKPSFVFLVWGNDRDVISDYGVSLENIIAPVIDFSETLGDA